jgi:hypothetical protein
MGYVSAMQLLPVHGCPAQLGLLRSARARQPTGLAAALPTVAAQPSRPVITRRYSSKLQHQQLQQQRRGRAVQADALLPGGAEQLLADSAVPILKIVLCCGVGAVCAKQVCGTAVTSQQPCRDSSTLHFWSSSIAHSSSCALQALHGGSDFLRDATAAVSSQLSYDDTSCLAVAASLDARRHASILARWP